MPARYALLALHIVVWLTAAAFAQDLPVIRTDRARPLEPWKKDITAYSKRHYGEATWKLEPVCIVLHYTAGKQFPWNLVKTDSFADEKPGLASHYVIDGADVWEIIPPNVRSRGAYGINHRAINIEMVAANATDLSRRPQTLASCVSLVRWLMSQYDIPRSKIYSHEDVSKMNPARVPEVKDLINPGPYGKTDPGQGNLKWVLDRL
ncbi:MAG: N-acetylmuramoyl-L-alanine amidase [Armatimonadetes bacterium]|nr:N-acetylmuramoyl-L-alanine amidase [Armatimonadota bacterium]